MTTNNNTSLTDRITNNHGELIHIFPFSDNRLIFLSNLDMVMTSGSCAPRGNINYNCPPNREDYASPDTSEKELFEKFYEQTIEEAYRLAKTNDAGIGFLYVTKGVGCLNANLKLFLSP